MRQTTMRQTTPWRTQRFVGATLRRLTVALAITAAVAGCASRSSQVEIAQGSPTEEATDANNRAVGDDSTPIELHDLSEDESPEASFEPVPELPPEIWESEPLMKDMTPFDPAEISEEHADFFPLIAGGRFVLVDDADEPLVVRDGKNDKLRLLLSAYHGADVPVVYIAYLEYFASIDPTYGPQQDGCDGGMALHGLDDLGNDTYRLMREGMPRVFDNRLFFGDYDCGAYPLDPMPEVLAGEFSVIDSPDGILLLSNEDGKQARFAVLD